MVQLFVVAFMIGIVGSFHCVGMCGPLALALPLSNNSFFAKFSGAFIYNAGRIVTYSVFGLVFGLIGQTAALFGFQQWLSIGTGALILLFIIIPKKYKIQHSTSKFSNSFFAKLRLELGRLFTQKNHSSLFVIGLLNGLLPCGLIYMAIAGAVVSADPFKSAFFMASFGLGTLPVMWTVSFFGNYIGMGIRQKIRKAYPIMMATRVLEGFSHLAIVVVGPTAIAAAAPLRHQGLAMSLWSSFFGLTYATGLPIFTKQ